MQMVNDFKTFFIVWNAKKAVCSVFCGRSIFEFIILIRTKIAGVKKVYKGFIF